VLDFEHGRPEEANFSVCEGCGFFIQDPLPSLEELRSYYPEDYRPHVSGSAAGGGGLLGLLKGIQSRSLLATYSRWLPRERDASIVDLGCGSGQFLRALYRAGYRNLMGIDREPRLATHFVPLSIQFIAEELEPDFSLPGRHRVIVMNYVLEHFRDPLRMLARCRDSLEPDGQVLVLTPNVDSVAHRVFGKYWSGLHSPRHTYLFSPHTLELAAKTSGFARVEAAFVTDPAGWAFSFQNRMRSGSERLGVERGAAWYGLATLPIWYPFAAAEHLAGRGGSIAVALSC
jgi:SAM-dependent methyltransferase